MSGSTAAETQRTRRLLAGVSLLALFVALLLGLEGSREKKSGALKAVAPAVAQPVPTPTPDSGEPPSLRQAAVREGAPFSEVKAPFEAQMDDRGRLWVLDSANSRIRCFDRSGGFFGGWGGVGDGKFSFRNPEGLALSGDNLYVADTWNHRVERFSLAGEWKGSVAGFMGPRGVAVAPDGSVWVADTGNSRVVAYDAALGNPRVVGTAGSEAGKFKSPVGIAVAPSGTVYVTDPGNGRIQALDRDGKFLAAWSLPWLEKSWQSRLETDQDGTLYVSQFAAGEVLSFDRSGAPKRSWNAGDSGEKFVQPMGLAMDRPEGMLYVVDIASHRILRVGLSASRPGRLEPQPAVAAEPSKGHPTR